MQIPCAYSGILISQILGFPNLLISRTKLCFPWICFTQALQFYPRFIESSISRTPDNSNQFWLPWVQLTLDNSNLRKFPNHLVRISITFTSLNKLALSDKLFSRILITQQAGHKSVISLKGKMTAQDYQHSLNWAMQSACLAHSAFLLMMRTSIDCPKVLGTFLKSQTRISRLQRGNKLVQIISTKLSELYIYRLNTTCVLLCSVFVF